MGRPHVAKWRSCVVKVNFVLPARLVETLHRSDEKSLAAVVGEEELHATIQMLHVVSAMTGRRTRSDALVAEDHPDAKLSDDLVCSGPRVFPLQMTNATPRNPPVHVQTN